MEIRDNENVCIIAPLCKTLDKFNVSKIIERLEQEKRLVAIDLAYVQDCTMDFIESMKNIKNKKLGIFNIPSDIFVLLNIMNIDKQVQLFVSEIDFKENSRQLINRKFILV